MWRLLLLLASTACAGTPAGRPPVVAAAASLTDVLSDIAGRYEEATGGRVALTFAGSNGLARQIRNGAPVDLFVSADEKQMDAVADAIVPGTRRALLANALVIAVPSDRPEAMTSPRALLDDRVRRVAVGEPSAVPAGAYAREYLQAEGLWDALRPKLVPTGSVRLALAAVESGSADAAIVFRTDVATSRRATVALAIPAADGPAISYPAALLRTGRNPDAARRFLAYLRGDSAREVFARAGFILP
jgi:molybdate transport system substrate-binding protein